MTNTQSAVNPAKYSKSIVARTLYENREQILAQWIERVKAEVKTANTLIDPIIVNTIPLFIERLAESLCVESARETANESSTFAQEHGSERARVTRYGPEQVIQEYQLLRYVVRKNILAVTTLSEQDETTIQKSFDKGLQESMISFFLVQGRIREQFVAGLTHDLRNPIGAMKLAADLIIDVSKDAETEEKQNEIRQLAQRILKQSRRADRLIQNMLDASVIQVGERLTLVITACNIADIVREAIGERPEKEMARLKVNAIEYSGFWDAEAFQRSIENLISNAIKYGDSQKPITVTVKESHQRVMVSVHNYGNPIPAEHLESLFQVFRRADAAKSGVVKGWGIGLALARSTAERMGGSLAVDSGIETGTTFTIDVPADARPFQDAPVV